MRGSKKIGLTIGLSTAVLFALAGCGAKEDTDSTYPSGGEVEVNNGSDTPSAEEGSGKTSESKEERPLASEKVPKTTRENLTWDDKDSHTEDSGVTPPENEYTPDFSKAYIRVNDGNPETKDFTIPYTLYYKDEKGRSIGGEAVVTKSTLDKLPELTIDSETVLYENKLLPTNLYFEERGMGDRNKVQLTKQGTLLLTKLYINIYNAVDKGEEDNHVYMNVQALYEEDNTIPFGIHIQAQSVHGDIKFNYIVNNKQPGHKVNYKTGEITEAVNESLVNEGNLDEETTPAY